MRVAGSIRLAGGTNRTAKFDRRYWMSSVKPGERRRMIRRGFLGGLLATPLTIAVSTRSREWLPFAKTSEAEGQFTSLSEALKNPDRARILILDKTPLATLPSEIKTLRNLSVLILHRNGLKDLPVEMSELGSLQSIYLGGSPALDFNLVVDKLASLPKLEGIGLDDNQMRQVPGGIVKLRTCKRLGLSSNGLKELLEALEGMEALETLDLYNNQLRKLAVHFDLVKHLRKAYVKDSGISPAE